MDVSDIVRYLEMDAEERERLLAGDDPPFAAVQAAAVRDFMEVHHLTDSEDAVQQFIRLRRAQAELLGLEAEEVDRFMEGLAQPREYPPKRRV
jgi:hypothetical protein